MTSVPDDVLDEQPAALGLVVDEDRGSLPYALLRGDPLVALAAWALADAGVTLVDVGAAWSEVLDARQPVVLQDALCPMTPPAFVAECVRRAVETDVPVVGVRPVTDTVKVVRPGAEGGADSQVVGETVDREGLVAVASPVVLPVSSLAALRGAPGPDLAALVSALAADGSRVELLEAPPAGRRVTSQDEVRVLEALTAR